MLLERGLRHVSRNLAVLFLAVGAYGVTVIFRLDQYAVTDLPLIGFAGMDLLITLLRGILAMPFLLIGWYLGAFYGRLPRKAFPVLALLLIPGGILALHLSVFDLHYLYVEPLHYLAAFLSCAGLIALMQALPAIRPLAWLGRNSLVIMCTHATFFVVYYVSLGMFFIDNRIPLPQPVFNLGVAVLVCAAEIPVVLIFNRYFGYLLGRKS